MPWAPMRRFPRLPTLLRIGVAAALIAWLIKTERLDLAAVTSAGTSWQPFLGIAGVFYLQILLVGWRWNLLLRTHQVFLPFGRTLRLTMIGMLSSLVMPGSLGGDAVKAYYVSLDAPAKRPQVVMTVLVDRLIGLLGLLTVAAGAAVLYAPALGEETLSKLGVSVIMVALVGLLIVVTGALATERISSLIHKCSERLPGGGILWRCWCAIRGCGREPARLLWAYGITVPVHLLACFAFFLATQALGFLSVDPSYFLLLVPIGLCATAIPISPAGIGVGQTAFAFLFRFVPGAGETLGADAYTLYQLALLCVYLTGAWAYVSHKKVVPGDSDDVHQ